MSIHQRKPKGQSRIDNPETLATWVNIRENRRDNQELTIQKHWQQWTHKTKDEDKQNTEN